MFIDTSGWANLYIPSETYHPLTAKIFQESCQQQQQLFTSTYVVSELVAQPTQTKLEPGFLKQSKTMRVFKEYLPTIRKITEIQP